MSTIKTQLAAVQDKHKAPKGSFRSKQFRRMLGLSWPHRRFIILGLLASIVYAAFNAVSIGGIVPVLKIFLSQEGLHGWVDRTVAESRLGVSLGSYEWTDEDGEVLTWADSVVVVHKIKSGSPLAGDDIGNLDLLVGINGKSVDAYDWFKEIASVPDGEEITLSITQKGKPENVRTLTVTPRDISGKLEFGKFLTSLMPEEKNRKDRAKTLIFVLCAVSVAVIISNVFRFLAQYLIALGTFRSMMDLRRKLYRKVLNLPMSFFSHNVSDLVSRFVQDVLEIQRGLVALFGRLFREPIRAIAIFVLALVVNWKITLVMVVMGPLAILLFWIVGRKIRKANERLLRGYGIMLGALETTLSAMPIIKAYTSENTERKRLWNIDRKMFRQQLKIATLEAMLKPFLEVVGILAVMGVAGWLGTQVVEEKIRPDEFLSLIIILASMFEPLRSIGDLYGRVQRSAAGAERIFDILDGPAEGELMEGAVRAPELSSSISFKDVVFTYPEAPSTAIDGISLKVNKGEVVAFVGRNGCGKTTLMRLLLRFYDPQEGHIEIDGQDIRGVTLRSLRDQFSLVTQDAVIFPVSVGENIAYGANQVSRETIIAAATQARADEFIQQLSDGYDTICGRQGVTLSGGQRQRIAIARAILRNAPVLIFDEATSQVDAESEARIQEVIREYARGRTTFIIAHRLSTIRIADRIVVIDKGALVDQGTHDELYDRCAIYKVLCQTQLEE